MGGEGDRGTGKQQKQCEQCQRSDQVWSTHGSEHETKRSERYYRIMEIKKEGGRREEVTWSKISYFDSFGNWVEDFLYYPETTRILDKFRKKADMWSRFYCNRLHSAEVLFYILGK